MRGVPRPASDRGHELTSLASHVHAGRKRRPASHSERRGAKSTCQATSRSSAAARSSSTTAAPAAPSACATSATARPRRQPSNSSSAGIGASLVHRRHRLPLIASCVVVVRRICTRCVRGLPVRKQAAGASARQCPICKAPTTLSRFQTHSPVDARTTKVRTPTSKVQCTSHSLLSPARRAGVDPQDQEPRRRTVAPRPRRVVASR